MKPTSRRILSLILALTSLSGAALYADQPISGIDSTEVVE